MVWFVTRVSRVEVWTLTWEVAGTVGAGAGAAVFVGQSEMIRFSAPI